MELFYVNFWPHTQEVSSLATIFESPLENNHTIAHIYFKIWAFSLIWGCIVCGANRRRRSRLRRKIKITAKCPCLVLTLPICRLTP